MLQFRASRLSPHRRDLLGSVRSFQPRAKSEGAERDYHDRRDHERAGFGDGTVDMLELDAVQVPLAEQWVADRKRELAPAIGLRREVGIGQPLHQCRDRAEGMPLG